tara:strand:- start:769 stop:912 length:144 start_codon:yes stop_codon:yes gene_type:complete
MAKSFNPKCAKCGKGLSVHTQKPGVGHIFVSKKKKTGGFLEPPTEKI